MESDIRGGKLVEFLETDHGRDFSESSSGDVEAVLSDETGSATGDSALSETCKSQMIKGEEPILCTSAFGVFAFVREPDIFVSHVEGSLNPSISNMSFIFNKITVVFQCLCRLS